MIRMPEHKYSTRALEEEGGGRKKRGRPKEKWLVAVMTILQVLGVMDWKRTAQNRSERRRILKRMEEL